ncbi:MAG: 2-C-methyl-D-erythritol 4-phosphate cytidylyltransferase [Planctomycetes bacterium]|nr:2-C-methyl-D-erythritol 4-phosphate cytidylyltransferase [Planctomycetota bacterium]
MSSASVIIAAGGAGRRFAARAAAAAHGPRGLPPTKVFLPLAGRPVLAHALERFAEVAEVAEAVVALPASCVEEARRRFGGNLAALAPAGPAARPLRFVAGGADRTESVARALAASDRRTDLVAIHDAVRPLIRPAVIREAMLAAAAHGAAVVGRPVDHTLKKVADGRRVVDTVPRERLWIAQTPQVFRRDVIEAAYAGRGRTPATVTDDAQLVEALGLEVVMVSGDAANLKITTPEDLRLCEALLAAGWPFGD